MDSKKLNKSLDLFIAYAREDEEIRKRLEKHLTSLRRQGLINPWHDGKIEPGVEWSNEIEIKLNTADIIVLLISVDFLHSDYCHDIEMKKALDRHVLGEAKVIPIIVRPCDWEDSPFSKLQALPKEGKPIVSWGNDIDTPLNEVAKQIKQIIKSTKKEKDTVVKKLSAEVKNLTRQRQKLEKDIKSLEKKYGQIQKVLEGGIELKTNVEEQYLERGTQLLQEKISSLEAFNFDVENKSNEWKKIVNDSIAVISKEIKTINKVNSECKALLKKLNTQAQKLEKGFVKSKEVSRFSQKNKAISTRYKIQDDEMVYVPKYKSPEYKKDDKTIFDPLESLRFWPHAKKK